jgi:hypothetical protein
VEADTLSFHAFVRRVSGKALHFERSEGGLRDQETGSAWNWQGICLKGPLAGNVLPRVQAHQEYWHSWQRFHTSTSLWRGDTLSENLISGKVSP